MVRAYLGIGGNLGYRRQNMRAAAGHIGRSFQLIAASSLYETAPVGYQNQPRFLNAVLEIETELSPRELLGAILDIEADLGRRRSFANAPRTIDIDVLLYGDYVLQDDDLAIPHPRMHKRAFVIAPLAEISPDMVHPRLGCAMRDLLAELGDVSRDVAAIEGPEWISATE